MPNKESGIKKLILNRKRPDGPIGREWRKRRRVEYDFLKSSHTNTKANKV